MAQQEPVKILELSGNQWVGGIGIHPNIGIGGLFKSATNFDPFEKLGTFRSSIAPTARGTPTLSGAGVVYFNVGFSITGEGNSNFYAFSDLTKLYRVKTNNGNITDVSSGISDISVIQGAIKYKSKVIYASETSIKANAIPVAIGSQVGILSVTSAGGLFIGAHVMKIGADRNLYVANISAVARITSISDKTLNTAAYLQFEDDVIVRDLENDGQYLVIAGDNNTFSNAVTGKMRCFVAFWNMKSQDLSKIWEFEDNRIYGIKAVEDEIIVFGRDNIYSCNFDTKIHPIMPIRGQSNLLNVWPKSPGSIITKNNGVILWGDTNSAKIYGYGRIHPSLNKVFFQVASVADGLIQSIFFDGANLWATTALELYDFGLGTTRDNSTLTLADIDFKTPYKFAFAKVILLDPLATGQIIALQISTQNGAKLVEADDSFDFATYGALSSHIFYPKANVLATDVPLFEDMTSIRITNTAGALVRRLEIWAYPVDPKQNLSY